MPWVCEKRKHYGNEKRTRSIRCSWRERGVSRAIQWNLERLDEFTCLDTLQADRRGDSPHTDGLRIIKEGPNAFKV